MNLAGWFTDPGAYVLVDGQFGSTGKGLMAGWIADKMRSNMTHVTTNAGPNSGHNAYFGDEKIMTQQLPIAGVFNYKRGINTPMILNAGAVIDQTILNDEWTKYHGRIYVHPCAALICDEHKRMDKDSMDRIASTGKGVGPA